MEQIYGTDLWDLTSVISSSREWNVVDPCRHVDHDLVLVHGDGRAFSLLQGQDNNRGVVCTKHALFPKQQCRASEATGTRHSLRSLGAKREPGSRRKRMKHFIMRSLQSSSFLSCDDKQETKTQSHFQKEHWRASYHHFVVTVAHIDSILGRHHIPQSIAAQDDVTVAFGVERHHRGVRLRGNHKLPAVEVVTPQIALKQRGKTIKTAWRHILLFENSGSEFCVLWDL